MLENGIRILQEEVQARRVRYDREPLLACEAAHASMPCKPQHCGTRPAGLGCHGQAVRGHALHHPPFKHALCATPIHITVLPRRRPQWASSTLLPSSGQLLPMMSRCASVCQLPQTCFSSCSAAMARGQAMPAQQHPAFIPNCLPLSPAGRAAGSRGPAEEGVPPKGAVLPQGRAHPGKPGTELNYALQVPGWVSKVCVEHAGNHTV